MLFRSVPVPFDSKADYLVGGIGNDIFIVNESIDTVMETASGGNDTIQSSWIDIDLLYYLGVENIEFTGKADLKGTGSQQANEVTGNRGANSLFGKGGKDTLQGGDGADVLTGGAGADVFKFVSAAECGSGTKRDSIADFQTGVDKIDLGAFIAGGSLVIAGGFTGVAGQVLFRAATGNLFGDVNGDAIIDFSISLVGITSVQVADFLF